MVAVGAVRTVDDGMSGSKPCKDRSWLEGGSAGCRCIYWLISGDGMKQDWVQQEITQIGRMAPYTLTHTQHSQLEGPSKRIVMQVSRHQSN